MADILLVAIDKQEEEVPSKIIAIDYWLTTSFEGLVPLRLALVLTSTSYSILYGSRSTLVSLIIIYIRVLWLIYIYYILYLISLYVCAHTLFTWLSTIPVIVIALDYWSQCILQSIMIIRKYHPQMNAVAFNNSLTNGFHMVLQT